ncbi:MAG: hemin uptake protein HemP [Variovorax sp.]
MPATTNVFAVHSHYSLDHSALRLSSNEMPRAVAPLESTELLRGSKTVGILHNGSLYRLQATKLGKLILTK